MKNAAKMAVLARQMDDKRRMNEPSNNERRYERNGTRMEYGGTRMDYDTPRMNYDTPRMNYPPTFEYPEQEWENTHNGDTEARFRDRRGREHYDNGRFAPRNAMEPETPVESRRYRRDDAGRFRSEYPFSPFVPPVYRGDDMNRIGFAAEPRREMDHDYRTDANYPRMDEMGHRTSDMTMGHAKGTDMMLTEEMAEEWMHGLQNEDGTKGPHWTKEQTSQVMKQKGVKTDPLEFHVILNALYSDYCSVFKKHGANNIDFYTDLAAAWLNDKDAKEGKAARYFQYIVK